MASENPMEVEEIDLVDGISARLENLRCFADALRDDIDCEASGVTGDGQLGVLRAQLDQILELTEALSHRLLERQPRLDPEIERQTQLVSRN